MKGDGSKLHNASEYIALSHSNEEEKFHKKCEEQSTKVQQSPEPVMQSQPQEMPWQTGVYQRVECEDQPIMEMPEEQPKISPITHTGDIVITSCSNQQ